MAVSQFDPSVAAIFQVPMNFAPAWRAGKGGPKGMRLPLNFTAVAEVDVDLVTHVDQLDLEYIQSMFVDNSANNNAVTFLFEGLQHRVIIPALAQGTFPVIMPKSAPRFKVTTTQVEGLIVPCILMNIPQPYSVWGAAVTIPPITVGVNGVTLTDFSGAATGASAQIIAANAARKYLFIGNKSVNGGSMYVNFGAAATANNGMEILPGGSLTLGFNGVSVQSVNLLGTNTEVYVCKEG